MVLNVIRFYLFQDTQVTPAVKTKTSNPIESNIFNFNRFISNLDVNTFFDDTLLCLVSIQVLHLRIKINTTL